MLKQSWTIFLYVTTLICMEGQVFDDFSDPNGDLSDKWVGDTDKFIITDDMRLKLMDSNSGRSSLFRELNITDSISWELWTKLDFDPSSSNRLEVHLLTSDTSLSEVSGYLLRIGENGGNDAITLIKKTNGIEKEIGRGTIGLVAKGPIILRLKILVENDFIIVEADPLGGICFETEIEAPWQNSEPQSPLYFGFTCIYTSTRSDKFYFDDVYVGPKRQDISAPVISQINAIPDEITVEFNEIIDPTSVSGIQMIPDVAPLDILGNKNSLRLISNNFDHTIVYEVVLNASDLEGNLIDTTIQIAVPGNPEPGAILINEILFDPVSNGSDFVELVNSTDRYIDLTFVNLINKNNEDLTSLSPIGTLAPGQFLLLTDDVVNILSSFTNNDPSTFVELSIPRFNNASGNVTLEFQESIIDAFDYDEDMHNPLLDETEGVSLERISLQENTQQRENWTSSSPISGFGSPGLPNTTKRASNADNNFNLPYKVFSPNNDGDRDELIVEYELNDAGYFGNVEVFNDRGHLIKNIGKNLILTSSGNLSWDGRGEDGVIQSLGLYIMYIQIYNLDGDRQNFKLTFGLGDLLD